MPRRNELLSVIGLVFVASCTDGPSDPDAIPASVERRVPAEQFGVVGTPVALLPSVLIRDALGNPVPGITVTFGVNGGTGTTSGLEVETDASGVATLGSWTLDPTPGTIGVTATVDGLQSSQIAFRVIALPSGFGLRNVYAGSVACGLDGQGAAFCWGRNIEGEIGDGTGLPRFKPSPVAGSLTFRQLSAGTRRNCGLTTSRVVYCWGGPNGMGGDIRQPVLFPTSVPFESIAEGTAGQKCGITDGGAGHCWGENTRGYLGDGTTVDRATPSPISGGLTFSSISVGALNTCGVTTANAAYCWGDNMAGQIGNGVADNPPRLTPVAVMGGIAFQNVTVGLAFVCGVSTVGRAYCWGGNGKGQLGDGTTTRRNNPTAVLGDSTFVFLKAGRESTCGLTSSGAALCWGDNQYGQLGDGTTTMRTTPVVAATGLRFRSLATYTYTCGVTIPGSTYCWGNNFDGGLGIGQITVGPNPVPIPLSAP